MYQRRYYTEDGSFVEGGESSKVYNVANSEGWMLCMTEEGDEYYYNEITQDSQWEAPTSFVNNPPNYQEYEEPHQNAGHDGQAVPWHGGEHATNAASVQTGAASVQTGAASGSPGSKANTAASPTTTHRDASGARSEGVRGNVEQLTPTRRTSSIKIAAATTSATISPVSNSTQPKLDTKTYRGDRKNYTQTPPPGEGQNNANRALSPSTRRQSPPSARASPRSKPTPPTTPKPIRSSNSSPGSARSARSRSGRKRGVFFPSSEADKSPTIQSRTTLATSPASNQLSLSKSKEFLPPPQPQPDTPHIGSEGVSLPSPAQPKIASPPTNLQGASRSGDQTRVGQQRKSAGVNRMLTLPLTVSSDDTSSDGDVQTRYVCMLGAGRGDGAFVRNFLFRTVDFFVVALSRSSTCSSRARSPPSGPAAPPPRGKSTVDENDTHHNTSSDELSAAGATSVIPPVQHGTSSRPPLGPGPVHSTRDTPKAQQEVAGSHVQKTPERSSRRRFRTPPSSKGRIDIDVVDDSYQVRVCGHNNSSRCIIDDIFSRLLCACSCVSVCGHHSSADNISVECIGPRKERKVPVVHNRTPAPAPATSTKASGE